MDSTMQQQKEQALFLKRIEDLADRAENIGYVVFSDFLDGNQRTLLAASPAAHKVRVAYIGGYEDAERVVAAFYPFFLEEGDWESPICAIRLRLKAAKFLSKIPQHRDYLGALMGLGIKREKLGDILVDAEGAVVVALESIAGYIEETLLSVGAAEVQCERVPLTELAKSVKDGKVLVITLQSLRLDGLISKGFNISRGDAAKYINAGKVSVNWLEEKRVDRSVKDGDTVSVRGFGRIKVHEVLGLSRSGRQQLKIERFG